VAQGSVVVTFPTIKKRVSVRAGKKYLARATRR
jgi:hypothetical protein